MICFSCTSVIKSGMLRCEFCGKWNFQDSNTKERKTILSKVKRNPQLRITSGPWDPCFGNGIFSTSVTLFAGEPGTGKSTLLLQIANSLASNSDGLIDYIATEEDDEQIKDRADRLGLKNQDSILIVNAMGGMNITQLLNDDKPCFVILDSLPGFTGKGTNKDEAIQVIRALKSYAQKHHAPAIVVDHVTKEMDFAGYMSLLHAVDCLIMFRKEKENEEIRILCTEKNRHGKSPCHISFEMKGEGLVTIEAKKPRLLLKG